VVVGEPTILIPPRDGSSLDPYLVIDAIVTYIEQYRELRIVLDPNAGGDIIAPQLVAEYGVTVVEHSQMASPMALAAQRLSDAIARKAIAHPDNRELTRHVLSAVPKSVGEGWRFVKSNKRNLPIDGVIALAMAHSVATAGEENGPSIYEERELLVL
jgi:phage terminase large subunit-like protein